MRENQRNKEGRMMEVMVRQRRDGRKERKRQMGEEYNKKWTRKKMKETEILKFSLASS